MKMFKRHYYLAFAKPTIKGVAFNRRNGYAVLCIYRKRNDSGKKKFYIDHQLNSRHLVSWWQAKWWLFLIRLYGRKSRRLFAYRFPEGHVFLKKIPL